MQKNHSILLLSTFFIVSSLSINAAEPKADFSHSRKWENHKSQKQQTQAIVAVAAAAAAQTPGEIQQPIAGAHAVPLDSKADNAPQAQLQQAAQADEKQDAEQKASKEVTVTNPFLWRIYQSDGTTALTALDSLKKGDFIDASSNPSSAKNLIRGAEEFADKKDREGMRKFVQKSKRLVAAGQLKTNDTIRHIARSATKAHLAQEREEVQTFLASRRDLIAKFLAAQHSEITQFMTARHVAAFRLKATEVDTYALGGVSENDDSDLDSYDSVDKYTQKQRKNERIEDIAAALITNLNKLRVDIDTISITKATQKDRAIVTNRDAEQS